MNLIQIQQVTADHAGVVAPWEAKLGQLDAASGVFTPRSSSDEEEESSSGFCSFLDSGDIYTGVPGMDAVSCSLGSHPRLCTRFGVRVCGQMLAGCLQPFQIRLLVQPEDSHWPCSRTHFAEGRSFLTSQTKAKPCCKPCCHVCLAEQVTEAEFSKGSGSWRLSTESAAGGNGASQEIYSGVILADVMTVSKSAVQQIS